MNQTTDVAALSAAVIAIAVSIQAIPDKYDAVECVTGFSLLLLIWAYVIGRERTWPQSAAVAAIAALAFLPVAGTGYEFFSSGEMEPFVGAVIWLAGAIAVFGVEWRSHPTRKAS